MASNIAPSTRGGGGNGVSNGSEKTALVVVDHGSRRAEANALVSRVAADLRTRTAVSVFEAHMELASPSIADAVAECAASGVTHVIVVPFFLGVGRHVADDIPRLSAEAVERFPGMSFQVQRPVGTHPAIIDVLLDRAGVAATPSLE